jgi:pimeloyl-ACP methyl ester carboxylesterase
VTEHRCSAPQARTRATEGVASPTHGEQIQAVRFGKYWTAIKAPILVLRGVRSDLVPADLAQEMVRRNPRARVLAFEGCGHAPPLMSHEQIEPVCEFLQR